MNFVLTALDVESQPDIFTGASLRECLGAADLLWHAARVWPLEVARDLGRSNVRPDLPPIGRCTDLDPDQHVERNALDVEILCADDRAFTMLTASEAIARRFVHTLSRRLLEYAPGMELVVAKQQFDWATAPLAAAIDSVRSDLELKRRQRSWPTPLLGLGSTVACDSSGLPALTSDDSQPGLKPDNQAPRPISAEVLVRLRQINSANRRLDDCLPQFRQAGISLPDDWDCFPRTRGLPPKIAVVHAEITSPEDQFHWLRAAFASARYNRACIDAWRDYTATVETAVRQALTRLSDRLLRRWPRSAAPPVIPFRPVTYGGHALTFVCDDSLGPSLAADCLTELETALQAQPALLAATAGAGVATLTDHFSFPPARAWAIERCRSARRQPADSPATDRPSGPERRPWPLARPGGQPSEASS